MTIDEKIEELLEAALDGAIYSARARVRDQSYRGPIPSCMYEPGHYYRGVPESRSGLMVGATGLSYPPTAHWPAMPFPPPPPKAPQTKAPPVKADPTQPAKLPDMPVPEKPEDDPFGKWVR